MSTSAVDRVLVTAGVRFAYLFGSRATGRPRPDSDADIAIMPGRPVDLLVEADLADDLRRASLRMRGRVLEEGCTVPPAEVAVFLQHGDPDTGPDQ